MLDVSLFPPGPINPRQLDPERVSGLLAYGVESHPDRAEVYRYLRAGAEFTISRVEQDPDRIRVQLTMTDRAPDLAELRAKAAGATIDPTEAKPSPGAELFLIDAPVADLQRVNQG